MFNVWHTTENVSLTLWRRDGEGQVGKLPPGAGGDGGAAPGEGAIFFSWGSDFVAIL